MAACNCWTDDPRYCCKYRQWCNPFNDWQQWARPYWWVQPYGEPVPTPLFSRYDDITSNDFLKQFEEAARRNSPYDGLYIED